MSCGITKSCGSIKMQMLRLPCPELDAVIENCAKQTFGAGNVLHMSQGLLLTRLDIKIFHTEGGKFRFQALEQGSPGQ